ncbi:MAG: CehA/McbA family metallohydrolase [Fuerstiella sp.]|nr:CehA/McbA family metallohydrolase [Fuerstiella sp.]
MLHSNCIRVSLTLPIIAIVLFPAATSAAEGRVAVRIVDEQGNLTPARAWVKVGDRRFYEPSSPDTATPYRGDGSFSCDGSFTMEVPIGSAVVHVEKGKEFRPQDVDVVVSEGVTVTKTIQVQRWIDMPARGWYSADLHVHLGFDNPRVLKQLSLADDVHLIPSFTYWLRGQGEPWHEAWPDKSFTAPIVVDSRHVITRNNMEIERITHKADPGATVGATFLYNLNHPVTAKRNGEHFPTDAELCRIARKHSPHAVFDSDKPSWAETVVGAALGMLDTIQVCHNHYNRRRTVPGGWGMIGPLATGESNAAVGDGLFHRTNALYYRFLNCGFRLGVSGGSAVGVMGVPTGYNLVYAKIDGPLTAEKMWTAIRTGRTFATTGPMLTLNAGNKTVGDTISINSNQSAAVSIRTTVHSRERLESLQIIHNGHTVASRSLQNTDPEPVVETTLEFTLSAQHSGWVASRALYRTPGGLLRQAHTSPIYISVDERPTASAEDARYMLRWIDQLVEIANSHTDHFPDDDARQSVLSIYSEARSRYEQIIDVALQNRGS